MVLEYAQTGPRVGDRYRRKSNHHAQYLYRGVTEYGIVVLESLEKSLYPNVYTPSSEFKKDFEEVMPPPLNKDE